MITKCAVCQGWASTANVLSTPSKPVFTHLDREDWEDNPHDVVPSDEPFDPPRPDHHDMLSGDAEACCYGFVTSRGQVHEPGCHAGP